MSSNHGDVGSYVAHALDHDERRAYESHNDACETCRKEQQEFSETLAELTVLAATPPPVGLRGDLLAAVRQVRPLPPSPRRPVEAAAVILPLAPRRRRVVGVLAGLVAAMLVAALSLGVWVHSLGEQHRIDVASSTAEGRLLSAPDAKIYTSTLDGAPVSYVVSRQLDQAMLIGSNVPEPGRGRTYQLWRITRAGAESAGLVRTGGSVHSWFQGPLTGTAQLAVTVEKAGGAESPSLPPHSAVRL